MKGLAGRCRGVVQGRGGVLQKLKDGRNPKGRTLAGGANLACGGPGGRGPGGGVGSWCDVVDELERDGLGVDQPPARCETVAGVRAQFCWTSSVADAVSLIKTSSQIMPSNQSFLASSSPARGVMQKSLRIGCVIVSGGMIVPSSPFFKHATACLTRALLPACACLRPWCPYVDVCKRAREWAELWALLAGLQATILSARCSPGRSTGPRCHRCSSRTKSPMRHSRRRSKTWRSRRVRRRQRLHWSRTWTRWSLFLTCSYSPRIGELHEIQLMSKAPTSEREKAHQINFLSLGFLILTVPPPPSSPPLSQHTSPPKWYYTHTSS